MEMMGEAAATFEAEAAARRGEKYVLQLFIAGSSKKSQRAVVNIQRIFAESLYGMYDLQVIDIFQQPLLAKLEQILAVPTLVKKHPTPKRLFIGDMSDPRAILASLEVQVVTTT